MPRLFPAFACAACAVALASVAHAQTHVVVTASRANIRSGPSTSARVVGTVVEGTRLRVVRALRG